MKMHTFSIGAAILLILVLTAAGCIAPPTGSSAPSKTVSSIYNPLQPATTPTTPKSYVTEVTPFETGIPLGVEPITTQGYSVFPIPSPVPEDLTCLIYTKSQTYAYNGSAFSFNLKNPPMFIEYSVIPKYITVHKMVASRTGSKGENLITYTDISPDSWFLVTVRNKITGEIYLRDGFGPGIGYSKYLDAYLKVLNRDDLLVEFKGNQITATVRIWVKPLDNFDNVQDLTFTECRFFDVTRNSLKMPTATPTPTVNWGTPTRTPTPAPLY